MFSSIKKKKDLGEQMKESTHYLPAVTTDLALTYCQITNGEYLIFKALMGRSILQRTNIVEEYTSNSKMFYS